VIKDNKYKTTVTKEKNIKLAA